MCVFARAPVYPTPRAATTRAALRQRSEWFSQKPVALTIVGRKVVLPVGRLAQKPVELSVWPGLITLLKPRGETVMVPVLPEKFPFQLFVMVVGPAFNRMVQLMVGRVPLLRTAMLTQ